MFSVATQKFFYPNLFFLKHNGRGIEPLGNSTGGPNITKRKNEYEKKTKNVGTEELK